MSAFELDRRVLARSFNRSARQYDAAASLQQHAGAELLDRLQYFTLKPERILDLGAGTCSGAQALRRHYPAAQVLAMDIAPAMLQAMPRAYWPWRRPRIDRVCADAYAMPLLDQSVDLIFSNLMLQWCTEPDGVFREIARVLRPGGLLVFSTFGPDTLQELRMAWAAADERAHVSLFADMPQLAEGLVRAGLAEPVIDVERYPKYYADPRALMLELKQLGARNAARDRARGLTGRARMQRMIKAYEALRTPQGVPATYEILFGAAFGGERLSTGRERGAKGSAGEYTVPISALGRPRS
jgi:malonyl-CoA O-methyltransferase